MILSIQIPVFFLMSFLLQVGIVEDPLITFHTQMDQNKKTEDDQILGTRMKEKKSDGTTMHDEEDADIKEEEMLTANVNPKQRLAITVKNWACMPENDDHLLNEGAVEALIMLSTADDKKIKQSCAGAYYHLSSRLEASSMQNEIIENLELYRLFFFRFHI